MTRNEFEILGNKHKKYESAGHHSLIPNLPIMARLDGRAFHTFTKAMKRPYDENMSSAMIFAAETVLIESNALIAYTQSDEITLVIPPSEDFMLFKGRKSKLESILAAVVSVAFYKKVSELIPDVKNSLPVFDCRVWQYPTKELCVESLLWREEDATRNSVSMAAQSLFSQKELHGLSRGKIFDKMMSVGVNWNDYPPYFKRGTYLAKRRILSEIESHILEKIPEKNKPKQTLFSRNKVIDLQLPPISKITNIVDVVFDSASPLVCSE